MPSTSHRHTILLKDAYQAELSKLLAYLVVAFTGFLVGLQLVLTVLVQGPGRLPFHLAELVLATSNVVTLFFGAVAVARYDVIAWLEEKEHVHEIFDGFGRKKDDGLTRRVSGRILRMEWGLYGNRGVSKYRIILPALLGLVVVAGLWLALFQAYRYPVCLPGVTC